MTKTNLALQALWRWVGEDFCLDHAAIRAILLDMRSVELFTGAGGLALGVSRSGFEHIAVIERDADIRSSRVRIADSSIKWETRFRCMDSTILGAVGARLSGSGGGGSSDSCNTFAIFLKNKLMPGGTTVTRWYSSF